MFHAIVGNSDVLLYEVDRVIINIDFKVCPQSSVVPLVSLMPTVETNLFVD